MGDSPLLGPDGDIPWKDPWVLQYDAYDPAQELLRKALCTLGNGRDRRGRDSDLRADNAASDPGGVQRTESRTGIRRGQVVPPGQLAL